MVGQRRYSLALRATGLGFVMITLALGQILWGVAYRWVSLTGGDNGLSGFSRPHPLGIDLSSPSSFYEAKYKDPLGIVFDLTHTGWAGAVKDVVAKP